MRRIILQIQYVELGTFITVSLVIFGALVAAFLILSGKIDSLSTKITVAEKDNEGDKNSIESLNDRMHNLESQRTKDTLQFTEAIGKMNVMIGKIEVTLENTNNILEKVDRRLEEQAKEITELKSINK